MFSKNEPETSLAVKHKNIGATTFCFHSSFNNFCKFLKNKSIKSISFYQRMHFYFD